MRNNTQPRSQLSEARQKGFFNIGDASAISGVSAKMIRHYEQIGLIPAANRTFANYRIYSEADVHTLKFIKRARLLGFSIQQISVLLSLWQDKARSSAEVKRLALEHAAELENKIRELQAMSNEIKRLAEYCHGDHRPDCPILDKLALDELEK
ncbi:MAG TPA: Cu(I)-responsive transcriptional regulator [Gammaproteobacteria bacterium]|jgi:Cu(I)-responsive transcriptional regulator